MRISTEAMELIKNYGYWFIQFPKFTYIRVHGSPKVPCRLPRYPIDKVIFLDVTRQLVAIDSVFKAMHKTGIGEDFPLTIIGWEAFPTIHNA